MNKQELINELKRISLEKQHKALTHPESKNYYEGMVMAYSQVVHIVNTVLKLDEPQKPIVKPFVAGWIEKSTDNLTKAEKIAYLIKSKDGDSYYFCDWFVRDGIVTQEQGEELLAWATRQSYETLLSLYNGYELEKEPLYCVIINGRYLVKVFSNTNVVILVPADEISQYVTQKFQLTEKQIKAIDERYWTFAVPVEEEAEE